MSSLVELKVKPSIDHSSVWLFTARHALGFLKILKRLMFEFDEVELVGALYFCTQYKKKPHSYLLYKNGAFYICFKPA